MFLFVVWLLLASPILADDHLVSRGPKFSCGRAIRECTETHLESFPRIHSLSDVQESLSNRSMVVEMVNALEMATSCLENVRALPLCHDHLDWVGVLRLNIDFLNSPGAIDQIVAVSQSPCLTNESIFDHVNWVMNECVMTFEEAWRAQIGNLCGGFLQLWECVQHGATEVCGEEYGELFTSWKQFVLSEPRRADFMTWLRAETRIDFNSCEQQLTVTRRYIEAVLPLLKKA